MKARIIQIIKEELQKDQVICFAYLFGSFLKEEMYEDIDIGIYLSSTENNIFVITSELKHRISEKLQQINVICNADDIDITILNAVAFNFLTRVFKEGLLIIDREPDFRTNLMEANAIKFRECLGLLKEADLL
ncbi:MAG: hypothetical protein A2Y62_09710 [Candidatus Fischerbacteria bacterium RBG_13_37_8]|uniref:Polymerase beta nucleotidyltransferase domain-containing protein n=1 Tax=Candidatus Fischerbacteria bacterium RBG_13_37_8 TaxID=1817863 RepID=A0A1F5V779_9BACT|nr:MAG: hypothetical protein A2Y62_09710 [Candidatus Fischerbacteria bacterium RBG_13_37_8]